MRVFKLTLATLALLLAGCSSIMTQRPTPTSTTAATIATEVIATSSVPSNTVSPTNTPIVTVGNAAENPPVTTIQPTPTEAAATSPTTTTVANTPAAVAAAQPQATGQEGTYENLASPVDLLASYYNAVTLQEYERAYSYWQEPPLDYESFASGYADTASVQVIVQPPTRIEGAAGSLYAEIPTFLIAQHHDGSVHSFAGCIVTRKSNLQPPDTPEVDVWHLYQARLTEVDNNASIPALLAEGCAS